MFVSFYAVSGLPPQLAPATSSQGSVATQKKKPPAARGDQEPSTSDDEEEDEDEEDDDDDGRTALQRALNQQPVDKTRKGNKGQTLTAKIPETK